MIRRFFLLIIASFHTIVLVEGQVLPTGFPLLEELVRRNQLLGKDSLQSSFLLRPLGNEVFHKSAALILNSSTNSETGLKLEYLPLVHISRFITDRPYGGANFGLIPNPGYQSYFSTGIKVRNKYFDFVFQPEFVFAQNRPYSTGLEGMTNLEQRIMFSLLNFGDNPEVFGQGNYITTWWGQSKLTFKYGAFEIGGSTQNIWWGPGQWNSLTFSNNAQGFPHLTFNTTKPAKTFLGNFEGQLVMGKLENSGFAPTQSAELNDIFFKPFPGESRYLNAITLIWNPKWIKGLNFGFTRTFQQYMSFHDNSFDHWFPIFERFQKVGFFRDGNTVEYDANGRDQTITMFGRLVVSKTKSELYFEYGKRDHAYNWREFILNPEHARAFILGYNQLFHLSNLNKNLQIRSEITHQQESVNRYIRNRGELGGISWHTHSIARGFANYGQSLGVGIGTGSNLQTMEISLVEEVNKVGVVFERLVNNQDFYYKARFHLKERRPWVDLSVGFLYDKQFGNLLLSSKLQAIHARNYQWKLDQSSTPEFPKGENLTSILGQVSLIYFWNNK